MTELKRSKMDTIAEVFAILGVVAAYPLSSLLAIVAGDHTSHFNMAGQVNGYGPRTDILRPGDLVYSAPCFDVRRGFSASVGDHVQSYR